MKIYEISSGELGKNIPRGKTIVKMVLLEDVQKIQEQERKSFKNWLEKQHGGIHPKCDICVAEKIFEKYLKNNEG